MPELNHAPLVLGRSKLRKSRPEVGEQPWEAFPMRVEEGELVVVVQNDRSGWWETWSLAHALAGIRSGFYIHEVPNG
jgi:hypothetical protein